MKERDIIMTDITNNINKIYLENYDIEVTPYISYKNIQLIINSLKKLTTWAERQQNIDMLLLFYNTNIGIDQIEEVGHDNLLQSGLIEAVKSNIKNLNDLYTGIDYTYSITQELIRLMQNVSNETNPSLKAVIDSVSKSHKKSTTNN